MKRIELSDRALSEAIEEMSCGLIDASLGGNLFKKRVALSGKGKRGGVRVIVAAKLEDRWFFIYGSEKNEKDNINTKELKALRELAEDLLSFDDKQIMRAITLRELEEIDYGKEI